MNVKVYYVLLVSSVILQLLSTIPFIIGVLVLWYILERNESIFVIAIVAGLVVDALFINRLGTSSLVFGAILTLAHLYERKFEIVTKEFVFLWTFLGSILYLLVLGSSYVLQQAVISALFAILMFKGIMYFSKPKLHD